MIVNRHIGTKDPYNGLSPNVLNIPAQWVGYPKAAALGVICTFTKAAAGGSSASATNIDYPRNVNVLISPTASASGVTGGGVTIYGRDMYNSTRSESFAGTDAISASGGSAGSINFARVDTVSVKLSFYSSSDTDYTASATDFTVSVGVGSKIGLPVSIASTDAIFGVRIGADDATTPLSTYSGATSTNNQWSASTGDYYINGFKVTNGFDSRSMVIVDYKMLGWRAPVGSY
jgi:hypothetical protein